MKNIIFLLILSSYLIGCSSLNRLTKTEFSISESTWDYTDSDGDQYQITFHSNGKLESTNPNDNTPENDYWDQKRKIIEFNFNDGYVTYSGKLKTPHLIEGMTESADGKWTWKMIKIK